MIRFLLLAVVVAAAVGFRFLPWQAKLGIAAGVLLIVAVFREKLFVWLLTIPFKMKGKVLREAKAEVHAVTPTKRPERENTARALLLWRARCVSSHRRATNPPRALSS